ncbi:MULTISPECIES: SDR family oxidoreductase [Microbacterium]|uniref:SDR family oxidoreductase n=1 Tax=Microbacterium wangchenii TaxID=2541726 RepID=A0ABX5STK1_9MICO|nr:MULTISPECIES: SDR family oxidoreductase [Microbacterium]MCK6065710.1 SDR family oxidoreductase [Microbacterium sp. EYE_512]QBR89117.1 SDR family oxidoreductase [Microbacterium wangchenii]TXK20837.1 SDR family oxidoreductase [Microbacterium wangchenii]
MAKIVVIGGTGLIGSKVVAKLREHGHEAVAAAPSTGVDSLTGEGLSEAMAGSQVVVDVSNSPSFEENAVMEFFTTSTTNLLAAEAAAGVGHHVALTIVGTDRPQSIPYFRAKSAQEKLIRDSGIPYSLVHATQFFEFLGAIADISMDGDQTVHLPGALMQPIAAEDVATAVARTAAGAPVNGDIEIAGPEQFTMDEFVRRGLAFRNDPRHVVQDPDATYYGAHIEERTLVPVDGAQIFATRLDEWLPANPPRR